MLITQVGSKPDYFRLVCWMSTCLSLISATSLKSRNPRSLLAPLTTCYSCTFLHVAIYSIWGLAVFFVLSRLQKFRPCLSLALSFSFPLSQKFSTLSALPSPFLYLWPLLFHKQCVRITSTPSIQRTHDMRELLSASSVRNLAAPQLLLDRHLSEKHF